MEDEGDEDEEDLQNVALPSSDLKRDVALAREALMTSQSDKQREALERAAQAAALAAAACSNAEKAKEEDDNEDDPLEKYMESIAKEVKSFRGNNATIFSTKSNENLNKAATIIKQEQTSNNGKASAIKIVTKTVKIDVSYSFKLSGKKKSVNILFLLVK